MLTHLTINDFAIVKSLSIAFDDAMSVITGETGAGKSIAIDALGLCLGYRSESAMIRQGSTKADICATFDIIETNPAYLWLKEHNLLDDDNPHECILRRILTLDGRSKAFVNNRPIPIAQMRELGQYLIHLNGQHAPQLLLKSEYQLEILDTYAHNETLLARLKKAYYEWKIAQKALAAYEQEREHNRANRQLLDYQVSELDEFALKAGEFESLEAQHKALAHSEELAQLSQNCLQLLEHNHHNGQNLLFQSSKYLEKMCEFDNRFYSALTMVNDALISVQEASADISHFSQSIELDPKLLHEIEARISTAYSLSRKHQVAPKDLPKHQSMLRDRLDDLLHFEERHDDFIEDERSKRAEVLQLSDELYQRRLAVAEDLSKKITAQIKTLAMEHSEFFIDVLHNDQQMSARGADLVIFNLRSNLGQKTQPLAKIASGGELSRISLAVQVLTASKSLTPTIIFDEVDVGISGKTASAVGKLLRKLARRCQVLCVTHLPQVASCGHHHFNVQKYNSEDQTHTTMVKLTDEQRVDEIARLLAGEQLSQTSRAHAQDLLLQSRL